jgi:hypothetical protein
VFNAYQGGASGAQSKTAGDSQAAAGMIGVEMDEVVFIGKLLQLRQHCREMESAIEIKPADRRQQLQFAAEVSEMRMIGQHNGEGAPGLEHGDEALNIQFCPAYGSSCQHE